MRLIVLIVFLIGVSASAQEAAWFYFRAKDTSFLPTFEKKGDYLHYTGTDSKLAEVLKNYKIQTFKKTWKHAKRENLKKTFFVIADKATLKEDLLKNASHVFEYGEHIAEADKKIFDPNDYVSTRTICENKNAKVNLHYKRYLVDP